jgi:hypothetical protein
VGVDSEQKWISVILVSVFASLPAFICRLMHTRGFERNPPDRDFIMRRGVFKFVAKLIDQKNVFNDALEWTLNHEDGTELEALQAER